MCIIQQVRCKHSQDFAVNENKYYEIDHSRNKKDKNFVHPKISYPPFIRLLLPSVSSDYSYPLSYPLLPFLGIGMCSLVCSNCTYVQGVEEKLYGLKYVLIEGHCER